MTERKNVLVKGTIGTTWRITINLLKKSKAYQPIPVVKNQDQKDHFEKQSVSTILVDLEEDLSPSVKKTAEVIFAAGSKGAKRPRCC
ncbi:MAG: hypothetical protein ACI87N_003327 [Flavobacteriales bacterium]|jgi:hypothetical protein